MDTTPNLPPPPPPGPARPPEGPARQLYRNPQGERAIGGVASGLAMYFGVAPALLRLAFILLAFAGGIGIILYIAAWIIVPERPASVPAAPPADGLRLDSPGAVIGVVLIVLAVSILLGDIGIWSGSVFWATVLIGIGILLFRRAEHAATRPPDAVGGPPPAAGPPQAMPSDSAPSPPWPQRPAQPPGDQEAARYPAPVHPAPGYVGPGYRGPGGTTPPRSVAPARPTWSERREQRARQRSPLGRFTIAVALMVVGIGIWLDQLDVISTDAVRIGAAALLVVGSGLLVGTLWGRARGLILVALLLAPVLIAGEALQVPLTLRAGERFAAPATVEELAPDYQLGIGMLHLDLSELALPTGGDTTVDVATSVGFGELNVIVPEDVTVEVTSRVHLGEYQILGETDEGTELRREVLRRGPPGAPTIAIDAQVGFGALDIRLADESVSWIDGSPTTATPGRASEALESELRGLDVPAAQLAPLELR